MGTRTARFGIDLDATTTLRDFAIVTFAVEPQRLARWLPPEFEVDTFRLADGSLRGFVSAVPFRDVGFHLAFAPWLRFAFGQINYRAYVRYRGERCVWFFGTMLGSPLVAIPRYVWRLPWHRARIDLSATWQGPRCDRYELDAHGRWGTARLRATGSEEPGGRLDGFADAAETSLVLTHPLRGYYRRRDGRIGTYAVAHERLQMTRAVAHESRFSVFEDLDLFDRAAAPHSVLLVAQTIFTIELPPTLA
jgi:uncharacterized protein YqjF (DUF2071 family)